MNTLVDYTNPTLLVPQLEAATPIEAISRLTARLEQQGRLVNSAEFVEAVLARENLSPTACSPGWALPHARLSGLPQLSFALGRVSHPLTWPGSQVAGVTLVWLFAVPEIETRAYLTLVSAVAKLNQNPALLEVLMGANDAASMFAVLQQVPLRRSEPARLVTATG